MKTTHLQHHPSLGYLAADSLRNLPMGLLLPHECSGFFSFRAHLFRKPERVIKNLHAAQRPLSIYGSGGYCFYGVQSDSPLAPLLLWDGAHFLNVGEKITVIEDTEFECYLDREYFVGSLKVIERSATSVTYKKVARLAAESDDDLDGWSFCLPVGPGDATVLNAVVKRILEIDVPRKEILLCGTPGSNFAYFDNVRIVGQAIAPSVFSEVDRTGFCFASPMRYNNDASYPTGSLYICRKDVWNACPLDESLHWVEYEDIEHALRASRAGIPNRINPFGITQSVTSRALLGGKASVESVNGCLEACGPCYVSLLERKPLLNLSAKTALARLQQFGAKYLANPSAVVIPTGLDRISVRAWIELIDHIVQQSSFRNDIDAVKEFLADFERLMLFDQLTQTRQAFLLNRFLADPVLAKQTLITQSCEVRNMLRQRGTQTWFVRHHDDYFHHNLLSLPGILISAVRAYRHNGKIFYFESVWAAVKAIYNSTPFKSYARGSK
ncbi:hypothetical protein RYB01_22810 [Pseudomonas syringae]|nr:hypothetical protein [Pseudomonas syringae]